MRLTPAQLENAVAKLIPHAASGKAPALYSEHHFREILTSCILSSRVPYDTAVAFAKNLEQAGIWDHHSSHGRHRSRRHAETVLLTPAMVSGRAVKYRFPRTRAAWVSAAVDQIWADYGTVRAMIKTVADPRQIRQYLVAHVYGMGPKQASMFLRDVGIDLQVAIIDTHVARFMGIVLGTPVSTAELSTLPRYEEQEARLAEYARKWEAPLGHADRAIWATMRAATNLGLL